MTLELNNYQSIHFSRILKSPLESLFSFDSKYLSNFKIGLFFNRLTEVWKKSLKSILKPKYCWKLESTSFREIQIVKKVWKLEQI